MKTGTINSVADKALMEAHELSMSRDPEIACQGRMAKVIINALDTWMEDEAKRETPASTMMMAAKSAAISAYFSVLVNVVRPDGVLPVARAMREPIIKHFDHVVDLIEKAQELQGK